MKGFVIMPFRTDFNLVYNAIKECVKNLPEEIELYRLDEIQSAGHITADIVEEIRVADFCIADVTGLIPNVMWEMGFATSQNKPIIIISQAMDEMPFDIRDYRFIKYDVNALESSLSSPLKEAVKQTLTRYDLFRKSLNHAKTQKVLQYWNNFVSNEVKIVMGRHFIPDFREPLGLIGGGDAEGLGILRAYFQKLGISDVTTTYSDIIKGEELYSNLILLGGGPPNHITSEALKRIHPKIAFRGLSFLDSDTKKWYSPQGSTVDDTTIDYGMIIYCRNPFNLNSNMLICAGCYSYGTWAGIRFIMTDDFINNPVVESGVPLECIVKTEILFKAPQNIKPEVLRPIS